MTPSLVSECSIHTRASSLRSKYLSGLRNVETAVLSLDNYNTDSFIHSLFFLGSDCAKPLFLGIVLPFKVFLFSAFSSSTCCLSRFQLSGVEGLVDHHLPAVLAVFN
eukprot:474771_1